MANTVTFTVKFNVDPPNIQSAIDAVNRSLGNIGVSITNVANDAPKLNALDDSFTKLGLRLNGVQNLFSAFRSSIGGFIQASNKQELAVTALTQALQQQGSFSQKTLDDMKAYAAQMQRTTAFGDELTIQTMAQLTAMGLQGEQLKRATGLAADLATVMGTDISSAARVMADAFNGNVGMLGRYIKGLDEADIKARGSASIIEQLTRAVGGQAVAAGETGAGALKRFENALDDLKETAGDLIKNAIVPLLGYATNLVQFVQSLPPTLQALTLGITGTAAAMLLFNASLGATPVFIGIVGTAFLAFISALRNGDPVIAGLAASLGVLGAATIALNLKFVTTSSTITTVLIPALRALHATIIANPWLLLTTAVVGGAVALYTYLSRQSEANKEIRDGARAAEEARLGLDGLAGTLDGLSNAELVIRSERARENVKQLKQDLSEFERSVSVFARTPALNFFDRLFGLTGEQRAKLQGQMDAAQKQADIIARTIAERNKQATSEKSVAALSLELEKLKTDAMVDGSEKRRRQIEHEFETEKQKIAERKNITEEQRNALLSAYDAIRVARLRALDRDKELEAIAQAGEAQKTLVASEKDIALLRIDLNEKEALARATTEREKYEVTRTFALHRITAEQEAALATLRIEEATLRARRAFAAPEERKRIDRSIQEISREREDITTTTEIKKQIVEVDYRSNIGALPQAGSLRAVEEEIASARQGLMDATSDQDREMWRERLLNAQNTYDLMILSEDELLKRDRQRMEERKRMWQEQNELAMTMIRSVGAGMNAMWNQFVVGQRQAKDEWDAVWLSMRNMALGALGRILQQEIEDLVVRSAIRTADVAGHSAAETTKTTITGKNALARVASAVWEGLQKGVVWAAEVVAFVAKEAAMTAVAVVQGGIRIATLLAEAAASILRAVAQAIAASGPFALFTAAAFTALGVAAFIGLKKAFGFARGGQFEEDQYGFIEGGQPELIAPRRTFDEIAQQEIIPQAVEATHAYLLSLPPLPSVGAIFNDERLVAGIEAVRDAVLWVGRTITESTELLLQSKVVPMIVRPAQIVTQQMQPTLAVPHFDDRNIVSAIRRLESRLDRIDQSVYVGNVVGEKEIVRRNIKNAEAYWERRAR